MADTTNTTPRVKEYVDYAQRQVDEQAILDKYNAATAAQFNAQREQNRIAENKFYNQMYNTQRTAMDTIRKANASAVTTGASRGVQAANELSALLGLEQESVASATELAQANRQTAQEETAAVLENVLNAYQQASQERSQLTQQAIEAASLDAAEQQAAAETKKAQTDEAKYMLDLAVNNPAQYAQEIAKNNNASDFANMTEQQYTENISDATTALSKLSDRLGYGTQESIEAVTSKTKAIENDLQDIYKAYGLDTAQATQTINNAIEYARRLYLSPANEGDVNKIINKYIQDNFRAAYTAKYYSTVPEPVATPISLTAFQKAELEAILRNAKTVPEPIRQTYINDAKKRIGILD